MAIIYGGRSKYLVKNDWKFSSIAGFFIPAILIIGFSMIISNILKIKGSDWLILILLILATFYIKKIGKEAKIVQKLVEKKAGKFERGWRGEGEVFKVLKQLSNSYIVFRDLNLYNKGNIDFVLLVPCGLLVIEVKSHGGRITFENGELLRNRFKFEKRGPLKQIMDNALDLRYFLKEKLKKDIFVTPVVIFSNKGASMRFGLKMVEKRYVIKKEFIFELINSLPTQLKDEEIKEIEGELAGFYK